MEFFYIVNFSKFQHYKNRNPPWIKLHTSILHSHNFFYLDEKSKLHLMLLWILASRHDNKLPLDQGWLQHEMGIKSKINFKLLKDQGFIDYASNTLAERLHDASNLHQNSSPEGEREKSREEGETEAEWLSALRQNPAYKLIDIEREYQKMSTWCEVHNKQPTRRRFINWLNRADHPMNGSSSSSYLEEYARRAEEEKNAKG